MERLGAVYGRFVAALLLLQHPLLLAVRVYWGYSLMVNGWGKLHNIEGIARWFGEDLGIPFPTANAWAAASVECFGSALLILGLASRPAALAVAVTMSVAFLTSDVAVFQTLATDPFCFEGTALGDCVVLAAPFPYWLAAVIVLVFGPGAASADAALGAWWRRRFARAPRLPRPVA